MIARLALCAGALALGSIAPAQAKAKRGCEALDVLANKSEKALTGLAIEIARDGTLQVNYRGKPSGLSGARDCALWHEKGSIEIDCSWTFEGRAQAEGRFNLLRTEVIHCIGGSFEPGRLMTPTDTYRELRDERWRRPGQEDESEFSINLDITEFTSRVPGYFKVDVTISREWD